MTSWRLLLDGHATAAHNMAVDEALLIHHARGETPPTLRLYGWRPAAVSIGFFQPHRREVDLAACAAEGLGFVRRPTGGRAVLHDAEVTYAVVIGQGALPGTVSETYRVISHGLRAGLEALGLAVGLAPKRTRLQRDGRDSAAALDAMGGSPACFDSPSDYELMAGGKKVVGSAQMRRDGVILQHGSILMSLDIDRMLRVLAFPTREQRERTRQTLEQHAGSLGEALGRSVTFAEVAAAVSRGFAQGLGLRLEPGRLTEAEASTAQQLAADKYAAAEWNQRK